MQSDLNRSPLETNLALVRSVTRIVDRSMTTTPQLPELQYLYQHIGRTIREGSGKEEPVTSLSNRPEVVFVQGSYRTSTPTRSSNFDLDILINSPVNLDLPTTPLTAPAPFPESSEPWDIIEGLIGTLDGPQDWSSQHDHYLYGTPKR